MRADGSKHRAKVRLTAMALAGATAVAAGVLVASSYASASNQAAGFTNKALTAALAAPVPGGQFPPR